MTCVRLIRCRHFLAAVMMKSCSKSNRKKILTILSFCAIILVFTILSTLSFGNVAGIDNAKNNQDYYSDVYGDFLINGDNCKIPNISPFSVNALKVFKRVKYTKCDDRTPLTAVERDKNGGNRLIINYEAKRQFFSWFMSQMTCCYHQIVRSGEKNEADNHYKLSPCISFNTNHLLNQPQDEFILTKCRAFPKYFSYPKVEIYRNAHAQVIPKISQKSPKKNPNVLLIGIDSISRLNLIRAMPETFKFVNQMPGWYDMKAYNKIGDNTFPNLNAVLNGRSLLNLAENCNWKNFGDLEKCRFLWNEFSDAGYVTAYGEDVVGIQTFNYYKTGFVNPPTDHYLRPFTIAAEENVRTFYSKPWLIKCLGFNHYADYIYQYGLDFAKTYQNTSHFGIWWTNSFSHDDLSLPSEYDIRMKYYLEELQTIGAFNSSIVIFFSDHGMRFGDIRKYYTGWLEERLPFLYIYLPESFKENFPELAENLKLNQDRLISPYDLHITIKHILHLTEDSNQNFTAASCETCQSLFYEVPQNRTCADAGIDKHWCTCTAFNEIDKSSLNVEKVVKFALESLNADLKALKQCAQLKLNEISSARESQLGSSVDYLISFNVLPSQGQMEATVRCFDLECENEPQLIGEISRINMYGDQSKCISDARLRKYCYCM